MFARGELKPVLYYAAEIDAGVVVRYRPGEKPERSQCASRAATSG